MAQVNPAPSAGDILKKGAAPKSEPKEDLGGIGSEAAGVQDFPQNVTDIRIQEMQAQIAALSKLVAMGPDGQGALESLPKVKQYNARLAFLNGEQLVTVFGPVKITKVNGEEVSKIKLGVLKDGKVEEKTVDYVEFMNETPRYLAVILKQTKEAKKDHQGSMPVRHTTIPADPVGLREANEAFAAREITLQHSFDVITCLVKFVEGPMKGEEVLVSAEALNR